MDWLLRRYTATTGARPVENRLEEALAFAQLLQLNPLVRGLRLGNIAGTANDALHAGALELARLGAVGDLLWCVIGAQPLVGGGVRWVRRPRYPDPARLRAVRASHPRGR